ncbi:hypothetical protein PoB_007041200 [Plakobranchus ocellatus]|uniref:Uncharacterized protein n=1 Tax=Plakobranchus ocellatus TaxID=259542 RepID=A0AAV4DI38_9GAST|nr:hypothetical protein PoB_007041200 [Plakobranchus ocellatus]
MCCQSSKLRISHPPPPLQPGVNEQSDGLIREALCAVRAANSGFLIHHHHFYQVLASLVDCCCRPGEMRHCHAREEFISGPVRACMTPGEF